MWSLLEWLRQGIEITGMDSAWKKCSDASYWTVFHLIIYGYINGWVNTRKAGDLGRHHVNYDVIVMSIISQHRLDSWYSPALSALTIPTQAIPTWDITHPGIIHTFGTTIYRITQNKNNIRFHSDLISWNYSVYGSIGINSNKYIMII